MNRCIVLAFALVLIAAGLLGVRAVFFRHAASVSVAQLLTEIPGRMRVEDLEYPDREQRFEAIQALAGQVEKGDTARLVWFSRGPADRNHESLVDHKYATLLNRLGSLLSAGPIQWTKRRRSASEQVAFLNLEKAIAISAADKIERHDSVDAFRLAKLGFQLARSLRFGGGKMVDYGTAQQAEWVALNGFWTLGFRGLLSQSQRQEILSELPPDRGVDPQLVAVLGRNLREVTLPYLVRTSQHRERLATNSFDPMETAHLYGAVYEQAASDAMDPSDWSWEHSGALVTKVSEGLKGSATPRTTADWTSRLTNDLKGNIAGRQLVARSVVAMQVQHSRQLATYRNMVRAALLAEIGKRPDLRDPLGHGNLQVDSRRRIVWSVGIDGVDDHGGSSRSFGHGHDLILRY